MRFCRKDLAEHDTHNVDEHRKLANSVGGREKRLIKKRIAVHKKEREQRKREIARLKKKIGDSRVGLLNYRKLGAQ
jgi:hypothetical protein